MFNTLLIIQCLSIVLMTVESIYIFNKWRTRQHSMLFLYSISVLLNNVGYFLEMIAENGQAALFAKQLAFFGKVFIPFSFFAFIIFYCRVRLPRYIYVIMACIQLGVLGLVITCPWNTLFFSGWEYVQGGMFGHNVYFHGPVFLFYLAAVAFYIMIALYFIIKTILIENDKIRIINLRYLMAAVVIEGVAIFLYSSGYTKEYDVTALGYTIAGIFLFIAIIRFDLLDPLDVAKNYALDNLSDGVIAIDAGDNIVYHNKPADKFLNSANLLESVDKLIEMSERNEFLFDDNKVLKPEIRQLTEKERHCGKIIVLKDITESYYYNKELEGEVKSKTDRIHLITDSIVTGLASVIESRDNSTGGHIRRTSEIASIFINYLLDRNYYPNISNKYYSDILKAVPMHDLGKIAVDDEILRKPGKYTSEEYKKMQIHCQEGAKIVEEILHDVGDDQFRTIAINIAYFHHEKWDGTGYPMQLKGSMIPFEARLMALADVFEALVSKRCYKEAYPIDEAFDIIKTSLGSHFDPELGKYFLELKQELTQYIISYQKATQTNTKKS